MVLGSLGVAALLAGGCNTAAQKKAVVPQRVIQDVAGAMTPDAVRKNYRTSAFVVRDMKAGKYVAVQDTELAPDAVVDDTNLVIWVEGAGDTIEGFRWSAHLVAESPYGFPDAADHLMIMVIHWSQSAIPVTEHLNRPAQMAGAALLNEMAEVHRQRHGSQGHLSIVGFSAGTRVAQLAFKEELPAGQKGYPDALRLVDNMVYVGSSMWSHDELPFAGIRGRFVNIINPRDTHFGDRAAFAAPAGESPRVVEFLEQTTLVRKPRFGASVTGFVALPLLTNVAQFDALDLAKRSPEMEPMLAAFRMVNVLAPTGLIPYSVFGDPLVDDDLDDLVSLAPNHYVMVGRGAGGKVDLPSFKQYREVAEEFVKEFLAAAVLRGRLYRLELKAKPKSSNPLKQLSIPVPSVMPWAAMEQDKKGTETGTTPNLDPKSELAPPSQPNGKAKEPAPGDAGK